MDGQAIMSVSAAVVALTQLLKWALIPDKWGPVSVLTLSLFGVILWGWSLGTFTRDQTFAYFAGWVAVSTSAAGIYGFTRAMASAVTSATPPPDSAAGNSRTVKE